MEELYKEYEKFNISIEIISNKIDEIYDSDDFKKNRDKYKNTLSLLYEEENNLFKEQSILGKEIVENMPPIKCNDKIDLRYIDLHCESTYKIYIHNTNICVGNINYRGQHTNDFYGDIGYEIDEKYRGNGYAYEAITLLGEKLYEEGITDFWVGVYCKNIPSIKTIEKYGGKIVKRNGFDALLYQCETKKLDIENNLGRSK